MSDLRAIISLNNIRAEKVSLRLSKLATQDCPPADPFSGLKKAVCRVIRDEALASSGTQFYGPEFERKLAELQAAGQRSQGTRPPRVAL